MMTKIFVGLTVLSLLGAGVLWWLLQAAPVPAPKAVSVVTEPQTQVDEVLEEPKADAEATEDTVVSDSSAAEKILPKLKVSTEPEGAELHVDGKLVGTTPFELELKDSEQVVVFKRKGFAEFTRQTPTLAEVKDQGDVNWKIQLKAEKAVAAPTSNPVSKPTPKSVPAPAPTPNSSPSQVRALSGLQGPAFIQIRAFESADAGIASFAQSIMSTLGRDIGLCRVEIPGKGSFVRVLAGPFKSRREAMRSLDAIKQATLTDAFVTGAQQCVAAGA
jgi:cell division septation protein DedD